ncbi:MAG: hypothetical protein F2723_01405 [Actinobacteria bacterium]|uniref:Unannotated protein n=1 Tax=freshwater metagenome TaxID=449393 RepID=A0A6J7MZ22_9ZZZZ|nr:hypothetical protein [Actinomycetota bacterium]MSY05985.1 hypothetical protein [Actinomycetota bacterium]
MSLLAIWSPKGGSGTSVVAAACSLVLARSGPTRLADLAGDQPAILGMGNDPDTGLLDWLALGPEAESEALTRLAVTAAPNLSVLPLGGALLQEVHPSGEAGAALAVALRDGPPTVIDLGTANSAVAQGVLEVADISLIVVRPCYLALRRGVRRASTRRVAGVVLVEEPGRALGVREIADVIGRPVIARVPVREVIARAVDAGVLPTRIPEALERAARDALNAVGLNPSEAGAAA